MVHGVEGRGLAQTVVEIEKSGHKRHEYHEHHESEDEEARVQEESQD